MRAIHPPQDEDDMALRALMATTQEPPLSEAVRAQARSVSAKHFGSGAEDAARGLLREGQVVGGYRIERILGTGGQAVVYLGRHERLPSRLAAIKVPHGEATQRMLREANVMARLDHPGILNVLDVDPAAEPPYLITDYCVGGSLADRIDAEGPVPESEGIRIAQALLGALSHAHAQGIVHRDLKPENVLFDSNGNPKIADFGLGKVVAEQLSLSLTRMSGSTGVAGTPVYMAPEQERPNAKVDARADLFAVGKLIYHMLTGVSPRTLRPLERERPGLEPAWTDLVFKLTATRPDDRFQSAEQVLACFQPDLPATALETGNEREKREREELEQGATFVGVMAAIAFVIAFFCAMGGTIAMVSGSGRGGLVAFIVAGFMLAGGSILGAGAASLEQDAKQDDDDGTPPNVRIEVNVD